MNQPFHTALALTLALFASILTLGCETSGSSPGTGAKNVALLNVSYDPTREFYAEFNRK